MTATEVNVRYERTLRMMSPTLGRLQNDLLDRVVINTFNMLLRHKQLPPPPQGVQEEQYDIEYTGPMPRAQKAEVAQNIENWLLGGAQLAEVYPGIRDIPDIDQAMVTIAENRGVPAKVINTSEEITKTRKDRADAEQRMQEAEALRAEGEAAEQQGTGAAALKAVEGAGTG